MVESEIEKEEGRCCVRRDLLNRLPEHSADFLMDSGDFRRLGSVRMYMR